MIGKLEMRCLYFDFRHVAGGAIFVGDRTTRQGALDCRFTFHRMTLRTLRVVVSCILSEWLMRIVTSDAADVFIIGIALTMENTIGLKTNVIHSHAL